MTPEDLKIRLSLLNDTRKGFNEVNEDLKRTDTNAKQTGRTLANTSKNMATFGRSAGQAGIQLQQFAGQIQGGVRPSIALSQQAADLGFVLGFPLLGAVTGIAAAIAGPFIDSLIGAEDSTFSLMKTTEKLEKAYKDLSETQQRAYRQEAIDNIAKMEHASFELRQEIYDVNNGMLSWMKSDEEKARLVDKLTAQLELNEEQIDAVKKSLQDYVAGAEDSDEANKKLGSSFETLEGQLKGLEALYVRFETPAERLNRKFAEADEVLRKYAGTEDLVARMKKAAQVEFDKATEKKKVEKETTKELIDQTEDLNWAYQNVADNGVSALEDGLVNLINGTGSAKDAFKSMATSIINDLIRMQIQSQITGALSGLISGFFGGGAMTTAPSTAGVSTVGGPIAPFQAPIPKALGGSVTAGQAYTVGEHGRETFVPSTDGQIVPNGAGGAVTINQTINVSTGVQQTVRAEIMGLMPQIANASKAAVLDARKRGGSYAGAF
jgi:peptidoglycan hydrolase CwlO-like protein